MNSKKKNIQKTSGTRKMLVTDFAIFFQEIVNLYLMKSQ